MCYLHLYQTSTRTGAINTYIYTYIPCIHTYIATYIYTHTYIHTVPNWHQTVHHLTDVSCSQRTVFSQTSSQSRFIRTFYSTLYVTQQTWQASSWLRTQVNRVLLVRFFLYWFGSSKTSGDTVQESGLFCLVMMWLLIYNMLDK